MCRRSRRGRSRCVTGRSAPPCTLQERPGRAYQYPYELQHCPPPTAGLPAQVQPVVPPHWPLGVMAVGLVAGAALVADEDINDELELRVRARAKLPKSRSAAAPETSGRHAIASAGVVGFVIS